MEAIAYGIVIGIVSLTVWAFLRAPGAQLAEQFVAMWQLGAWGKQILVDFYALELVLALWMVSHAIATDSWLVLIPCLVTMPAFGATSAALYWILAVA